jgi:hypothetical protein
MTWRNVTFAGFALIVASAAVWSAIATRHNYMSLPGVLGRLNRSRVVRLVFVLAWAWLGWHLFARGSGAFE